MAANGGRACRDPAVENQHPLRCRRRGSDGDMVAAGYSLAPVARCPARRLVPRAAKPPHVGPDGGWFCGWDCDVFWRAFACVRFDRVLSTLFLSLYHRWQIRSLRAKLLVPIAGLMVISLLASTMVFLVSTTFTRNWLLDRQTKRDARRVSEVMTARAEKVPVAARLLAGDPNIYGVVHLNTEEALSTLNARAVMIRNRFSLALSGSNAGGARGRARRH